MDRTLHGTDENDYIHISLQSILLITGKHPGLPVMDFPRSLYLLTRRRQRPNKQRKSRKIGELTEADDIQPLVCDHGARMVKAGFARDDAPRAVSEQCGPSTLH